MVRLGGLLSPAHHTESIQCPRLMNALMGVDPLTLVQLYFDSKTSPSLSEEGAERMNTPVKIPSVRRINTYSADLDITGSPLRADFDPNEVFDNSSDYLFVIKQKSERPIYSGLDVKTARTLLSQLNVSSSGSNSTNRSAGSNSTNLSVDSNTTNLSRGSNSTNMSADSNTTNLILCQSEGPSYILYLGNRVKDGRLAGTLKTTCEGPLSSKTLTGIMGAFVRQHANAAGSRGGRTVCRTRAEYLLSGEDGADSFLLLESCWDQSGFLLESPPPDAATRLKVSLVFGDERFACDTQTAEIELLEGLVAGLSGEALVWRGREEDSSLEDEVLQVLEASRRLKPALAVQDSDSDNVLSLQSRQDVDITDMMWTVLSRSQSYAELTDSLNLLFNTILSQEIRPFIYSGNRSGMAGILRDLVRSGTLPDLSGSKPLTLLVEMGIEKLRRDSSHFLLSSDLATKEAVDPFLVGSSLHQSLDLIKRLHMVVELSFACQTYLSLPSASLNTLVQSALLQFRKLESIDRVQMEFPIQTSDVKSQLETGKAGVWQQSLEGGGVRSVVQLQVDKPVELYPAPPGSAHQPEVAEPEYYLIRHTEISHNF